METGAWLKHCMDLEMLHAFVEKLFLVKIASVSHLFHSSVIATDYI